MAESLLSFSEVLIFGRVVRDLEIAGGEADLPVAQVASTENIDPREGLTVKDGDDILKVEPGEKILLMGQDKAEQNGLYTVGGGSNYPWENKQSLPKKTVVRVERGSLSGFWRVRKRPGKDKKPFKQVRKLRALGKNRLLEDQIGRDARLARIYGFAYEGTYYDLPEPTLFLVHGKGKKAYAPTENVARAPLDPSESGVAAAEYQVADGIRVWDYDKADYTIRMDVMTGMFEQVLLDVYFGGPGPGISGAKVSGAKVSGAKVSGAKVSGAKVSGAKARGSD